MKICAWQFRMATENHAIIAKSGLSHAVSLASGPTPVAFDLVITRRLPGSNIHSRGLVVAIARGVADPGVCHTGVVHR